VSVAPRVLLLGGVPVSRSRVRGDAVGCVLPPSVARGVAAGVPRGAAGALAPGLAFAPAFADVPDAAPVAVVAPVVVVVPVVVLPETPTPTAAPPLTP
jgi:hypothetical protein